MSSCMGWRSTSERSVSGKVLIVVKAQQAGARQDDSLEGVDSHRPTVVVGMRPYRYKRTIPHIFQEGKDLRQKVAACGRLNRRFKTVSSALHDDQSVRNAGAASAAAIRTD